MFMFGCLVLSRNLVGIVKSEKNAFSLLLLGLYIRFVPMDKKCCRVDVAALTTSILSLGFNSLSLPATNLVIIAHLHVCSGPGIESGAMKPRAPKVGGG